MAAPTATSFWPSLTTQARKPSFHPINQRTRELTHENHFRVLAAQGSGHRQRAPPGVDTRIHWENEDDGWIGGNSSGMMKQGQQKEAEHLLNFVDLLDRSPDSYYQILGVPADADLEVIRAAYGRLGKECHPDTTTLPLIAASNKFRKLNEIYEVLKDDEMRKFYDWTLAQRAESQEAEKMRIALKDPHKKEVENLESIPDTVDRLSGRNMELNDQAKFGLTFDILTIIFSLCCMIYAVFFKEPN